jgi:hypothetical protein
VWDNEESFTNTRHTQDLKISGNRLFKVRVQGVSSVLHSGFIESNDHYIFVTPAAKI